MAWEGELESIRVPTDDGDILSIRLGSFVTLKPSTRGPHRVKQTRQNDLKAHWKARVLAFEFGRSNLGVRIQHIYSPTDMANEIISTRRTFPKLQANWLCLSEEEDIVSPDSITSIFHAFHVEVGSILFANEMPIQLRDQWIWFYKFLYRPKSKRMEEIPLPVVADMDPGPIDSMSLLLARKKLMAEIQNALKERGSVCGTAKLFLPINFFISMFKSCAAVKKTMKMFTIKDAQEDFLESMLFTGWEVRVHDKGAEDIECRIKTKTLHFKYCLRRQILYTTFKYRRYRHVLADCKWNWIPLEQDDDDGSHSEILRIPFHKNGQFLKDMVVESEWTLFDIRRLLEAEMALNYFKFFINREKIGRRREDEIKAKDCMPPKTISIHED